MVNSPLFLHKQACIFFSVALSSVLGEDALVAFCFSFRRDAGLGFNYGWTPPSFSPENHPGFSSHTMLFAPPWQVTLPMAVSLLEQKAVPGAKRRREPVQSDGYLLAAWVPMLVVKLTAEKMLHT